MVNVGLLLLVVGGIVWIAGAKTVQRDRDRRLGVDRLMEDQAKWSWKGFSLAERWGLAAYAAMSLIIVNLGLAILDGKL